MLDLLLTRRSIRKFTDKEVEREKLDTILKCGLLAPSSRSRRPWEFIVVNDKAILGKIAKCKEHGSSFLANAPIGIVIIADPAVCDVWVEDASIVAVIMQLAAQSLGLGSCWIQVRERTRSVEESSEAYLKKILNIPASYKVECILAIGYPGEEKPAYAEGDLPYSKIHVNHF